MNPSSRSRLQGLRDAGVEPWPARSRRTHSIRELRLALEPSGGAGPSCGAPVLEPGASEAPLVVVAGRLVQLTPVLLTLADATGHLTVALRRSPAHPLAPGDLVEVALVAGPGSTDAPGLVGLDPVLLAPALGGAPTVGPGPRPFAGITPGGGADLETLSRRSQLLHVLRTWFVGQGFVEVDTPILAATPGMEPHLDPFETVYRRFPGDAGRPRWLLTSPEYAMKRLVVAGLERCFQLSRAFRNGETGPMHNPEFTLLEWYRAFASYTDLMTDTEDLVLCLARAAGVGTRLSWRGHEVALEPPWERLTVREAVGRYAGFDLAEAMETEHLAARAARVGVGVPDGAPWDEIFFRVLLEKVEPRLGFERPTFLVDYPAPLAALARIRHEAFPVAERFELYVAGVEVANAFTELADPVAQAHRFAEEQEQRRAAGAPVFEADQDYLDALEAGLPPTGGIALGVDRLLMLLLDRPDVRATLAFPFQP